jgi:HD superfamily phosphohydrolase
VCSSDLDYLLRDAYFTGVVNGRYDSDQLVASLRAFAVSDGRALGVDARGIVALESFVLARYMMFATVYFHHTTRMFERVLHDALRELWPEPRALDPIDEFLAWDDFRVLDELGLARSEAARALRNRETVYGVVAEFNAERDLSLFEACLEALRTRWGDAIWPDSQEQLLHRLPLGTHEEHPTVLVGTRAGVVDARTASDLIGRLSGKAYWRKLFALKRAVPIAEARRIARDIMRKNA